MSDFFYAPWTNPGAWIYTAILAVVLYVVLAFTATVLYDLLWWRPAKSMPDATRPTSDCLNCGEYMPMNLAGTERVHECDRTPPQDGLPPTIYACPVCGGHGARRWGCWGRPDRPHEHAYMRPLHELVREARTMSQSNTRTEGVIYVVTNGNGGEVDSWWPSASDAQTRADKLNAGASMVLAWGVVSVNEGALADV